MRPRKTECHGSNQNGCRTDGLKLEHANFAIETCDTLSKTGCDKMSDLESTAFFRLALSVFPFVFLSKTTELGAEPRKRFSSSR